MNNIVNSEIHGREKEQLVKLLFEYEQKYYDYLIKNFKKHFDALKH